MPSNTSDECFVSVDIEASGPIPAEYSLLALGACLVADPATRFYIELKPINRNYIPEALAVSSLDLDELSVKGTAPGEAMARFRDWLGDAAPVDSQLVFVGFNAAFDWSFVNWYFHKFINLNPFEHAPLDIKSFYMGMAGCSWSGTKSSRIPEHYQPSTKATHHALEDAVAQAEMFAKLLAKSRAVSANRI